MGIKRSVPSIRERMLAPRTGWSLSSSILFVGQVAALAKDAIRDPDLPDVVDERRLSGDLYVSRRIAERSSDRRRVVGRAIGVTARVGVMLVHRRDQGFEHHGGFGEPVVRAC